MGKSIRTVLLTIVTGTIYLRTIFELFFRHNLINSLIGILIFFIIFHFFYIDIYAKDSKKVILIGLSITLLEIIGLNFLSDSIMIGGVIALNMTIIFLGDALQKNANESTIFKVSDYFRSGGYIFTMGIAIAYSLFSIGLYHNFPFSCDDLNKSSGKMIGIITKPINLEVFKDSNTQNILNDTKIKDILLVSKTINIESDIKGIVPIETFKTRKNELITKTIEDNNELNQGICEYSLNKLNEKLQYPGFQASVIVLMVAISYPFLRIAIQIISLIGLIFFMIMKKIKIYKIKKIISEVEKIN